MRPLEVVEAWVEAFNQRDVDRLASFYCEDATNYQVAESPVIGREAIRAMFKRGFDLAEMVCIPENLFEDGEWAILEWSDPTGLRGYGFFHIRRRWANCVSAWLLGQADISEAEQSAAGRWNRLGGHLNSTA